MQHHSSRRSKFLGKSFLATRLKDARSYDRIAGYFSSSILEVAGEELESVSGKIRIVCNSELQADDVACARTAMLKMRQEWTRQEFEKTSDIAGDRYARFLAAGKLEVRVLPDSAFGLIHGKAGVIDLADGTTTAFLGSANESKTAWKLNYELLWEDGLWAHQKYFVKKSFDAHLTSQEIEDEEESEFEGMPESPDFKTLSPQEKSLLESYLTALESNNSEDPKFAVVKRLLKEGDPRPETSRGRLLAVSFFPNTTTRQDGWRRSSAAKHFPNDASDSTRAPGNPLSTKTEPASLPTAMNSSCSFLKAA